MIGDDGARRIDYGDNSLEGEWFVALYVKQWRKCSGQRDIGLAGLARQRCGNGRKHDVWSTRRQHKCRDSAKCASYGGEVHARRLAFAGSHGLAQRTGVRDVVLL